MKLQELYLQELQTPHLPWSYKYLHVLLGHDGPTAFAEEGGGLEGENFFVLKDLGIAHKAAAIGTKPHDGVEPGKAEEMFATHKEHVSQSSEALQRALELQPDHWMNYVELAELYELSGDHESRAEISVKLVDSVRKSLLRQDIPVRCIFSFCLCSPI